MRATSNGDGRVLRVPTRSCKAQAFPRFAVAAALGAVLCSNAKPSISLWRNFERTARRRAGLFRAFPMRKTALVSASDGVMFSFSAGRHASFAPARKASACKRGARRRRACVPWVRRRRGGWRGRQNTALPAPIAAGLHPKKRRRGTMSGAPPLFENGFPGCRSREPARRASTSRLS